MPADPPERDADNQPTPSHRAPKVDRTAQQGTDPSKAAAGQGSPDARANDDRYATETAHTTPESTSDDGPAIVRK